MDQRVGDLAAAHDQYVFDVISAQAEICKYSVHLLRIGDDRQDIPCGTVHG